MPRIRFARLNLNSNLLTMAGVVSLVPALRRPWGDGGLRALVVWNNPLGNAGVAALAKALPPTLEELDIQCTDCGNDGLVALAAALPTLVRLTPLKNGGDHSFGGRFGPLRNRPTVFWCHFLESWRQDGENREKTAKKRGKNGRDMA